MQAIPIPQIPDAQALATALLAFIAGMTVPTRYGIERLNGFGRAVASKLPYQPPPGKDAQEAMAEAVDEASTGDNGAPDGMGGSEG